MFEKFKLPKFRLRPNKTFGVLACVGIIAGLLIGPQAIADLADARATTQNEIVLAQAQPRTAPVGVVSQIPDLRAQEAARAQASPSADAVEGSPQDAQMRVSSIRGNCWCEFSCTSSCGGNLNPGRQSLGGLLWQHLESNRQECKNRCDNAMDAAVNNWSAKGQISCTGTSWVGTNTGKSKSVSYTTNKGACPTPDGGGPATACCPPIQKGQVSPLFERLANGPPDAPFGLAYVPNAAFNDKMVASAALGALNGGCSPITVTHTLRNMTASGTPVVGTVTVTYSPGGYSAPVTTGSWTGLAINTTYKVETSVSCPPRVTGYYASNCPQRSFQVAWSFSETRLAPGANPPAAAARAVVSELN